MAYLCYRVAFLYFSVDEGGFCKRTKSVAYLLKLLEIQLKTYKPEKQNKLKLAF